MDFYSTYAEALVALWKRQIQAMDTPALEASVFRFVDAYFARLPGESPEVATFRTLVEQRDLGGLRRSWASLMDSFVRLEAAAQLPAEQRFQQVYYLHFEMLVELCKRSAA